MVAGFIVHETITVVTQNGNCVIELCFGDITKLRLQDKVDVLMVSAFRGDYATTRTSVIGALKYNLNLSVRELAKNKAEDLRDLYSCWWSQELPSKLPYKRLLCFETRYHGMARPQELVGDVYRCLVPILNNQDGTVITPLLNTGDQGHSKVLMLKGMVEAAVNWMKAGLPLRKLKIVLYSRFEAGEQPSMAGFQQVCTTFQSLKDKFNMQSVLPKVVNIEYDVYLSFSKEDGDTASNISEKLQISKPDIRIFSNQQQLNKDQVWQEDMYEIMIRCARVITVLSPHYLKSTPCVEQYNIALCCNRKSQRDLLAPFYVEPVENMPTYMGLVQYVDCLTHSVVKLSIACEQLALTLNVKVHAEVMHEHPQLEYDVFISYCHRNSDKAAEVMKIIKSLDPNLKVFFDTEDLKTGTTWQQTLYHSIDGAKVLIAMLTKEYLQSPVCREEFNLALAKHCQKDRKLTLIPMFVDDDLDDVPLEFRKLKLVSAMGEHFMSAVKSTAKAIVSYLKTGETDMQDLFVELTTDELHIDTIQESLRSAQMMVQYPTASRKGYKNFPADLSKYYVKEDQQLKSKEGDCDVAISFTSYEKKYTTFFIKLLTLFAPSLSVVHQATSQKEMRDVLDNAKRIVAFVSPSYIESHDHEEEFNIALCRHRFQKKPVLFPIQIHTLPKKPTYFHTVKYPVSTADLVWSSLIMKNKVILTPAIEDIRCTIDRVSESEALALTIAAGRLLDSFRQGSISSPAPRPVLANLVKLISDRNTLTNVQPDVTTFKEMLLHVPLSAVGEDADTYDNEKKQEIVESGIVEKEKGNQTEKKGSDREKKTGPLTETGNAISASENSNNANDSVIEDTQDSRSGVCNIY